MAVPMDSLCVGYAVEFKLRCFCRKLILAEMLGMEARMESKIQLVLRCSIG